MAVVPNLKVGFNAGVKYWLILMVSFFVLRYDWVLCIVLGAIGGLAIGVIASWWKAEDNDLPEKQLKPLIEEKAVIETPTTRVRFRRYGAKVVKPAQTVTGSRRWLKWLPGRKQKS